MSSRPDQSAELKFVVTNTLIVQDIRKSVAFYRDVLGAKVEIKTDNVEEMRRKILESGLVRKLEVPDLPSRPFLLLSDLRPARTRRRAHNLKT